MQITQLSALDPIPGSLELRNPTEETVPLEKVRKYFPESWLFTELTLPRWAHTNYLDDSQLVGVTGSESTVEENCMMQCVFVQLRGGCPEHPNAWFHNHVGVHGRGRGAAWWGVHVHPVAHGGLQAVLHPGSPSLQGRAPGGGGGPHRHLQLQDLRNKRKRFTGVSRQTNPPLHHSNQHKHVQVIFPNSCLSCRHSPICVGFTQVTVTVRGDKSLCFTEGEGGSTVFTYEAELQPKQIHGETMRMIPLEAGTSRLTVDLMSRNGKERDIVEKTLFVSVSIWAGGGVYVWPVVYPSENDRILNQNISCSGGFLRSHNLTLIKHLMMHVCAGRRSAGAKVHHFSLRSFRQALGAPFPQQHGHHSEDVYRYSQK